MKRHFTILSLTLLAAILLSCNNSNSNTGQTSSLIAAVTPQCFMQRLNEFKSAHNDLKNSYEPLHYASCQSSQNDFMQRLNEFKTAHNDLKNSYEPLYFASSQHNMTDFMQRLNEFKTAHNDLKNSYEPLFYAGSENNLCN